MEYIYFGRLTINKINTKSKPKGGCYVFDMADAGDYLRKFITMVATVTEILGCGGQIQCSPC